MALIRPGVPMSGTGSPRSARDVGDGLGRPDVPSVLDFYNWSWPGATHQSKIKVEMPGWLNFHSGNVQSCIVASSA